MHHAQSNTHWYEGNTSYFKIYFFGYSSLSDMTFRNYDIYMRGPGKNIALVVL
jgi:hypothetical protein